MPHLMIATSQTMHEMSEPLHLRMSRRRHIIVPKQLNKFTLLPLFFFSYIHPFNRALRRVYRTNGP